MTNYQQTESGDETVSLFIFSRKSDVSNILLSANGVVAINLNKFRPTGLDNT